MGGKFWHSICLTTLSVDTLIIDYFNQFTYFFDPPLDHAGGSEEGVQDPLEGVSMVPGGGRIT